MVGWTVPSVLAFIFSFLYCCNGQRQSFVLVAPNLIRTDSPENIFLQASDFSGSSIDVTITIRDFQTAEPLSKHSATLNSDNNFLTVTSIQVPSHGLKRDEKANKFVVLKVQFGSHHTEERVIMVSFQAGYIFIQTDKPIYRPGDTVQIRAFVSSLSFKASDATAISLDIKNPEGVIVEQKSRVRSINGVYKRSYPLPDIASEGKWIIVGKFDHWPQNNFNATFEVKKYVLPAFNVTLIPNKPFLDVDDSELQVEIKARYFYGEAVKGMAYVVYGLKKDQKMMRAPKVKQVEMLGDGGTLQLSMAEIKQACEVQSGNARPDCAPRSLVDSYVYIKVSVLTESGGDLVEAEKSNIKIVHSPYVLTLKNMPKYFKPDLPFYFTIHVTYHDGSPADNIPLKVNLLSHPLTSRQGTATVSFNMPNQASEQKIIVTTAKDNLHESKQAVKEVTVQPYSTNQPNYLYIHARQNKVQMRETSFEMSIKSERKNEVKEITYLIVSKGKILEAKRQSVIHQQVTTVTTKVTAEMMPSFRFVAFYTLSGHSEVVSDSMKLEVEESCAKPLVIGPKDNILTNLRPGKSTLKLEIRGEPLAHVSLVAVDQAVYLLSKNRFNQRHILDEVESRDMACTYGSGKNSMGVFYDAGLVFASSAGPSTESRQELTCRDNARRRRSAALMEHQAQLMGGFEEKLLQRCCRDGLRGVAMLYSCEQRSHFITEGPECIKAFLKCCEFYRNKVNVQMLKPGDSDLGRGSQSRSGSSSDISDPSENEALSTLGNDEEFDIEEVYLRDKLDDTWLWMDVVLPEKADMNGVSTFVVEQPVPDSITEWSALAVSSSPHTGFCVSEPWNFVVDKPFFVDIKMPFSVARNEQVEIKAVVYNYLEENQDVNVILKKTTDMCSVAFKRDYKQKVRVKAKSSHALSFTVVPFKTRNIPIEVVAYITDGGQDRIQKILKVVTEGVQKTESVSITLEPNDGTQTVRTSRPVLKGQVPYSDAVTKIIFTGNILAESIDNAIYDDALARLIRMPYGCVEQNLAAMTYPIIAAQYLEQTNGWMNVGVQRKIDALNFINRGYTNQLSFRRSDGSYPPYRGNGPSTWVTAYVVKVFSMAYPFVTEMNLDHICEPLDFLIKNKQSNGRFTEDNPVRDLSMSGGLHGNEQTTTLTAFVIIALAELLQMNIDCGYYPVNTQDAINKAVPVLKSGLQSSSRPYTKAITSYALALLNDQISYDPVSALLGASSDGASWVDPDSTVNTLEATGYALLTLVKMGRLTEAKKPFDYLSSHRSIGGGSGNTQSTMVVLQALSKYVIAQPGPVKHSLNVDLQIASPTQPRREFLLFKPESSYQARSFNVPEDANLEVVARGNGKGTVEVVTFYNQLLEEDAKSCTAFDLQVSIVKSQERPPPGMIGVFDFTVTVRALRPEPALSVILDISLPTGFTPETTDLENLLNSVDRYINHFYFDTKLSERTSLIIHMYSVSNTAPRILSFKLNQQFNVGLLQPSSVTVYEYYRDTDQRCTRLYTPPQDQDQLTVMCRNRICTCAQDDCCEVKEDRDEIPDKERGIFACKTLHHVFKVKVLNVTTDFYEKYEMEITRVIKLGLEDGVLDHEKRFFYSHGGCRESCELQMGAEYLIMGPESDRWTLDSKTNKYMYVLGKDTWVEHWPTPEMCKNPEVKPKCDSLAEAERKLNQEGCRAKK